MIMIILNANDTFYDDRSFVKMFNKRNFISSMLQALMTTFIACHLRNVYLNDALNIDDIKSLYNLLNASHRSRFEIKMNRYLLNHIFISRLILRRCYSLFHKYH